MPWIIGLSLGAVGSAIFLNRTAPVAPSCENANPPVAAATVAQVTAPSPTGSPAIDANFEIRMARQVGLAVQAALTDWFSQNAARVAAAQQTVHHAPEAANAQLSEQHQQRIYESLRGQLRDAVQNRGLTWGQLNTAPEMKQLPKELRDKIYAEVAEMLNRGELNPDHFLGPRQ